MAVYEYSIAAGYNNAGGLVNIENIVPSSDIAFYPPIAYNTFSRGILRVRADQTSVITGFQVVRWLFAIITRAQWRYLQATYTTGGNSYSGPVTIRTHGEDGFYHNYNAIMTIPPISELKLQPLAYQDVEVTFKKVEAI